MVKSTISLLLLLSLSFVVLASGIFEDIGNAIKSGDAHQISRYIKTDINLTILNQEEVYSKAQAEQILKDFFMKNTPKSFTVIHNGISKEGSKYAIGNLITAQGISYRTYIYVKQSAGVEYIQELRFEKE
jgi:hypothetical protein